MKHTVVADYAGAGATHDTHGEYMIRARDRRDADRAVVIHMTYEQMVDARDRLTALIDNPPEWTRAGRRKHAEAPACPAGLLPMGDGPVERCVATGPHTVHVTATGEKFTTDADV
jgi:hypothetical protein